MGRIATSGSSICQADGSSTDRGLYWSVSLADNDAVTTVRLTVVPNEAEAEIVCGMLRDRNIKCGYRKTDAAGAWTVGFASGGPIEILVDDRDFISARKLIARP